MTRRISIFLLALVFPLMALADPAKLTVEADRTSVTVGERINLTVTLEGDGVKYGSPFQLPDLSPYLTLVGQRGPFSESSTTIINGRMERSAKVSITYQFEARKAGTIKIPPLSYPVENRTARSNPIEIAISDAVRPTVIEGDTGWRPPSDPYVRVELDKDEAYVGEQIVATVYLYYRNDFINPELAPIDTGTDFIESKLGYATSLDPKTETFGGERWKVAYLYSQALFPIKAGEALIRPVTFKYFVATGRRSFFGPVTEGYAVSSDPIKIKIKPLPVAGRPADFEGEVGSFDIKVTPSFGSLKANEQFKFTVSIEGTGHMDYISKPRFEPPEGFDLYTEGVEKDYLKDKGRAVGRRRFKMILVPHKEGKHVLPPFTLSYFDPESGQYKTAKSPGVRLMVSPGDKSSEPLPLAASEPEVISAVGADLRYVKPDLDEYDGSVGWLGYSPAFAAAQLAPAAAVLASIFLRRRKDKLRHDVAFARRLRANKESARAMREARAALAKGDSAQACADVYRALAGFVSDNLNLAEAGLTAAEVTDALLEAGASEEAVELTRELLGSCDMARFGLGEGTDARSIVDKGEALLARLAKETRQ